ncbi:ADP-ribosylglycohydrolase family protein [Shewanella algae]|uniref:ADP-ribosylglycohydrolase family protein n=1 Tax=Shewanella algae TaxID=38313 RepID=UPI00313E3571
MQLNHANKADKAKGTLIGLALGDALGTTLEFQSRPKEAVVTELVGGGPFQLQPGQWTDDTSMMLCLADSLIKYGTSNPQDQMHRYIAWRDNGLNSCTGRCFDIGTTVNAALHRFERQGNPLAGSDAPSSAGNGSLMRIAPVALFCHHVPLLDALEMAEQVSRTTHAEQRCIEACQYLTYLLHVLLNSEHTLDKAELLTVFPELFTHIVEQMHPDSCKVIRGSYQHKNRDQIRSSGFVIDSLEAALWCFWHSDNFESGAVLAANLGDDADTVAAIYGQLAGAYYGYEALPKSWLHKLAWHDEICLRAYLLLARQNDRVVHRYLDDCRLDTASNFAEAAYEHNLVLSGWDWQSWAEHHRQLLEFDSIKNATIEDCLCLITALIRSERFNDGLLQQLYTEGKLQLILKRFGELTGYGDNQRYLFIGDVHGQLQKLEALLDEQGANEEDDDTFYVFVGDLIDNRPNSDVQQLGTLARVKALVDSGRAECLMGNHELNAIGWVLRHPTTGEPLRTHSPNNLKQHQAFLTEVDENSAEHLDWIEWFKQRPLFADYGDIRAIHACWDDEAIKALRPFLNADNSLKQEYWPQAFDREHQLYQLLEVLLKGPELALPEGHSFRDKTGQERKHIRVRWWLKNAATYRQLAQVPVDAEASVPELFLPHTHRPTVSDVPVVIGHYTLSGVPSTLSDNVVCVDFNAAKGENPLVGYEWIKGEQNCVSFEGIRFVDELPLDLAPIKGVATLLRDHIDRLRQQFQLTSSVESLVEQFLWQEWDPLGVAACPEGIEEYQSYVQQTALLAVAGDAEILSAWLWTIEIDLTEVDLDQADTRALAGHLAMKLIELVRRHQ